MAISESLSKDGTRGDQIGYELSSWQEIQEKLTGAVGDFDVLLQELARFEEVKRKELRGERKDQEHGAMSHHQGRVAKETPRSTKDGSSQQDSDERRGDRIQRSYP